MQSLRRLAAQPLTAIVVCALTVLAMSGAWSNVLTAGAGDLNGWTVALALLLGAAIVLAGLFPIHLRYHTKIALTTPPQFIMAVLVPPPLAALCIGTAIFSKEVLSRPQRGNTWSDILTATGRLALLGYLSSLVAHSAVSEQIGYAPALFLTALVMFSADVLSTSVELLSMTGEPYWRLVCALVQEGSLPEGVQYLLGILGVLAASQGAWALLLIALPAVVVYFAFKTTKEMQRNTRLLLESMSDAVDLRDPYTGGHSRRVAELSAQILRELHIFGVEADLILTTARVHDIGKIGIPDAILLKEGKLTAAERAIMQTHSARGAELLSRYQDFARGASIVRHHHERWDGGGYPDGLKGYEIPFGGRVIAVADSLDAMTSDRPYRKGMSMTRACSILREERGRQWDAEIVDACLRALGQPLEQPDAVQAGDMLSTAPAMLPA